MRLDARGPWRQDARLDIRGGFGSTRIRLPDDVNVDTSGVDVVAGHKEVRWHGQFVEGRPTLILDVNLLRLGVRF